MLVHSSRFSNSNTIGLESQINNRVLIKIPLDSENFWQKEYDQNDLIEKIIQDFKSENLIDVPDDYFLDFYFQNKELKPNDTIKSLLNYQIPTLYINQMVRKKPIILNRTFQPQYPDLVGRPFSQPFEVFLFSREDKTLKIQLYDTDIINTLFLNEFCPSSAYCNGNNHLFISGGERYNGELIDYFWEIDLKEQIIAEPTKIIPKKDHSMIYIPDKYVFIIGGNDKKCIFFNTETAEVEDWAKLNKIRVEPALQLINNYLYCFDSINNRNNEKFTVEKTDLDSCKPKWDLLVPKMDKVSGNEILLTQQFFGVSKDENDDIIFIGGKMADKNKAFNYKYNTRENMIQITNIPFFNCNFKEKTFLPFKKNIDLILPDFDKENPEIMFYMKNKNKTEVVNYQPKTTQTKLPPLDYKYDFNMPKVAVPEPISSLQFDQENINNNISNSNSNMNKEIINGNNDFNNNIKSNIITNNNNDMPITFQEPEIEPAKEDLKLSLDLQNKDILDNNINNDINIKEPLIDSKDENELNGISLISNNEKKEIEINTNINEITPINNIKEKEIDLFHDINITGTIIGDKTYKLGGNINQNINTNSKGQEIKNQNINLNINSNNNENLTKSNNVSANINIENPNNNNVSPNINISPVNINTQKNIFTKIKENIPKYKYEINTQTSSMPDFNLNGNIPGTKKTIYLSNNNSNNNTNNDNNKGKELFKLTGIIKGTGKKSNSKVKNTYNKNKEININTGTIKGSKSNSPKNEKKLSIPKLNLEGKIPEYSESDINININNKPHMIDLRGDSNVNNPSYEINNNSPTFHIKQNLLKNENTIELNGSNNNLSINNGNNQGSKIELSSFDNMNFKEIRFEQKNLGKRINNLNNNEDNNIKANIPSQSINAKLGQSSKSNNKNENIIISGIIPGNQISKHPFMKNQNNSSIKINNNQKSILNPTNKSNIQNGNSYNINYNVSNISELNTNIKTGNNFLLNNVNYNNNNSINMKKSQIKDSNLPLVGEKKINFISDKVEPVKFVEVDNININNLKSSNVGINGIKLGEKTEE